jgi:hypothetical protein
MFKRLFKERIPYKYGIKRFNTYDYGRKPDCEICDYAIGTYFGFYIGKNRR